jgi:hypothetical protein
MKYEIQHFTLCDGWINTWSIINDDGESTPEIFDSLEEAKSALIEFFYDDAFSVAQGWREPETAADPSQYRIVKQEDRDNDD